MQNNANSIPEGKPLTYGQCQAVKVLVAQRLGLAPTCTDDAVKLMQGVPVHPMQAASVDREAASIHNTLAAGDPSKVDQANVAGNQVLTEYGFAHLVAPATQQGLVTR